MANFTIKIFSLFFVTIFLNSCTINRCYSYSKKNVPPTTSFVKIYNKLTIKECIKSNSNKEYKTKKTCTKGEWISSASGIIVDISSDFPIVLTAGHICYMPGPQGVKSYENSIVTLNYKGQSYPSEVIIFTLEDTGDTTADLCLLRVPDLPGKGVSLSAKAPSVGERLRTMAAVRGIYHPPVVPIFEGIFSGNLDQTSAMVTIPAAPGASGAAVLNSNNEIVGVIYAVSGLHPNVTLMTEFEVTKKFILNAYKLLNGS